MNLPPKPARVMNITPSFGGVFILVAILRLEITAGRDLRKTRLVNLVPELQLRDGIILVVPLPSITRNSACSATLPSKAGHSRKKSFFVRFLRVTNKQPITES